MMSPMVFEQNLICNQNDPSILHLFQKQIFLRYRCDYRCLHSILEHLDFQLSELMLWPGVDDNDVCWKLRNLSLA